MTKVPIDIRTIQKNWKPASIGGSSSLGFLLLVGILVQLQAGSISTQRMNALAEKRLDIKGARRDFPAKTENPEKSSSNPARVPDASEAQENPVLASEATPDQEEILVQDTLPPAPTESIVDSQGLPAIAETGQTPFAVYRRPVPGPVAATIPERGGIALILMNWGKDPEAARQAIRTLPAEVSLALSPYSPEAELLVNEARADGHEVLSFLPMQTEDFPRYDPGPLALLGHLDLKELIGRTKRVLRLTPGTVGVAAPRGNTLLQNDEHLRPLLSQLFARGVMFLDTNAEANPNAQALAAVKSGYYAHAPGQLPDGPDAEEIQRKLQEMGSQAHMNGQILAGTFEYTPLAVRTIAEWAGPLTVRTRQDLENGKGPILVPVSFLASP